MKCNVCGGAKLVKGAIRESGGGRSESVYFFARSDRSFFEKLTLFVDQNIYSYACVSCGNLQFIVDFDEETKRKYLESGDENPPRADE